MRIPGTGLLKTGIQAATNPAGFLVDQASKRLIETDEDGKELPEIQAFQVKLDRIAALLSFIAERTDPEGYEQVFGTPNPPDDTSEAESREVEAQPQIPSGYSCEVEAQPRPEDAGWL